MSNDYISPTQQQARDRAEEEAQNPLTTMTKEEIIAWMDANVTDPATKTALKMVGRALIMLWKDSKDNGGA